MKKYLACATAVALSLTIGSLPASAQTVGGCSKDIMKNEGKLISAIGKELSKISGSYFKLAAKYPGSIPAADLAKACLLYTSPSPRDQRGSRMPSSA